MFQTYQFDFVEEFTWLAMIVMGIVGLLYSGEKIMSIVPFLGPNTKDKDSAFLKFLSVAMGVVASIWMALLILDDDAMFSWLTIILLTLFMVVSLAHPVRALEGWKVIILAVPFVIIAIIAFYLKNDRTLVIFGNTFNLWFVLGFVAILMLILFVLVFFVEETVVDPLLWIVGWTPIKLVVTFAMILQGIALLFNSGGLVAMLGL